jgi:hypothetical protein
MNFFGVNIPGEANKGGIHTTITDQLSIKELKILGIPIIAAENLHEAGKAIRCKACETLDERALPKNALK